MTTAVSEKDDKRRASRRERRRNGEILSATHDGDRLEHTRSLSDPWCMDKDGKLRFDPKRHPELVRK